MKTAIQESLETMKRLKESFDSDAQDLAVSLCIDIVKDMLEKEREQIAKAFDSAMNYDEEFHRIMDGNKYYENIYTL